MNLTAKEIATRYVGRTVRCKVTKSSPVSDAAGNVLDHFDAKIVGWKFVSAALGPSYVCVEVLPPGVTQTKLDKFNSGYIYPAGRNKDGWGKKLLPEEIVPPADAKIATVYTKKKDIPEWPDKCRDCGSPAFILTTRIDCSNSSCKNKFKTHSAQDLFLPKEMRPPGWDKDPNRKRRAGVDKDDFVICDTCKLRAVDGSFVKDKVGSFKATCPADHKWTSDLHIGDKINGKRILVYKGKNVFVPYRV